MHLGRSWWHCCFLRMQSYRPPHYTRASRLLSMPANLGRHRLVVTASTQLDLHGQPLFVDAIRQGALGA